MKLGGLLVAPTEPAALRKCGTVSMLTEQNGVDLLWGTRRGLVGVQRKELRDLVASMQDGRLAKEVSQMDSRLWVKMVMVEGRGSWTSDGALADGYMKVTRKQLRGFLWSVRSKGVWVEWTDNLHDTIQTVQWLMDWTRKDKHRSLMGRPGPSGSAWGKVSDRDWAIHLLTSFDGIGPDTAERILEHFGGVPLTWTISEKELMEVKGVGKVRAGKMIGAVEGGG